MPIPKSMTMKGQLASITLEVLDAMSATMETGIFIA